MLYQVYTVSRQACSEPHEEVPRRLHRVWQEGFDTASDGAVFCCLVKSLTSTPRISPQGLRRIFTGASAGVFTGASAGVPIVTPAGVSNTCLACKLFKVRSDPFFTSCRSSVSFTPSYLLCIHPRLFYPVRPYTALRMSVRMFFCYACVLAARIARTTAVGQRLALLWRSLLDLRGGVLLKIPKAFDTSLVCSVSIFYFEY